MFNMVIPCHTCHAPNRLYVVMIFQTGQVRTLFVEEGVTAFLTQGASATDARAWNLASLTWFCANVAARVCHLLDSPRITSNLLWLCFDMSWMPSECHPLRPFLIRVAAHGGKAFATLSARRGVEHPWAQRNQLAGLRRKQGYRPFLWHSWFGHGCEYVANQQ